MSRKFSHLVDLLSYRAAVQPEKIAFTFLGDGETVSDRLTYYQLNARARAIAATLRSLNASGERALLLYAPGLEFISAFFGCLYAGVVAVPAYPPRANRSIERLQAIVSDAQADFALTTEALVETIEGRLTSSLSTEALRCLTTEKIESQAANEWQAVELKKDNLAFLQYTSGSTGMPKGVMVSHENIMRNSETINRCFGDTEASIGVSWLPPYHDMGLIGGILQPIFVGVSMTLMPPVAFLQRPFRWLQTISRERATTSGAPNFAYELCLNQISPEQRQTLDLSRWTLAFSGAEPVRADTLDRFAAAFAECGFQKKAFYPCYGMAETTLLVSGGTKQTIPNFQTFDARSLEQDRVETTSSETGITLVSCGKTVEDDRLCIVNPQTLELCQSEEIGEIWVASKSVAQGYWNRPKQTQETFRAYIANTQEGPFLRTGDLGFVREGELFVTGRLKDLIIIRGRNHYPQDIELTVEKSHEAIREATGAAFSLDVEGEERLVITYEIKRTYLRKLDVDEVARAIRKAVVQNHELQPFAIAFLRTGSIPKTSSGKIQRHACKAGFLESTLDLVGEWRQGEGDNARQGLQAESLQKKDSGETTLTPNNRQQAIQKWLVKNLAGRLEISPLEIDVKEPFASYGLDSVQAVRLSAELEDLMGVKLSPTLAYDYPNIEMLAAYLAELGRENHESEGFLGERSPDTGKDAIAIVGMGCRFPGAENLDAFWRLLREGKDAITQVEGRWEGETWGGFLESVDRFDAPFFGITPREANEMDPQQRLLLETSWEALENAGIAADKLAGSATGVFIGISSSDYSQLRLKYGLEPDAYVGTGNAHSIAANRLSYFFDFRGPSLAVDTACSSSLVAVHLAIKSLQHGECDRAIAGGVNLILSSELTQTFVQAGMMSPEGRCKTFDESADGYVRGEGCGAIVLKRFSDALRDGDNVLAIIKGSAIVQDGRSNGLTAPSGLAQQAVIRQALKTAGVAPAEIDYIETHGTGTVLGDPIEVNSLKTILMQGRSPDRVLWLGSLKSNIGHLESAAGIAGLIKAVLCLQNQEIPANLHFKKLNPHIDLKSTPIAIPTQAHPWRSDDKVRIAGVSSFGFGGTNAHVILQESLAAAAVEKPSRERPLHLLALSAKDETALDELVELYENYLSDRADVSLADLCYSANVGRSHFSHRLAIATNSREHLQQQLAAFSNRGEALGLLTGTSERKGDRKIAFLFTGQGSQYVGMGYQLYQTQPTFKAALDRCAEILQAYLEKPLLEVLYPAEADTPSLIDETAYTQPALFAIEYALAQLWQSWGIKPSVMMGHSVGEYVAATLAGVFSLEDGLKLIANRARLMQALPPVGTMVALMVEESRLRELLEPLAGRVDIAAINGKQSVVISGETEAVETLVSELTLEGIKTKKLQVSHAFHSFLMEPMLAEFERVASEISYKNPAIDIISNLTGELVTKEIATPQYWVKHVRQPVKFAASIEFLYQQEYKIFLEIGAKPTLSGMGRAVLEDAQELCWLPSLRAGQEDWQQMLASLATLFINGVEIDWVGCDRDYIRTKIKDLPTYPFQRQRYWLNESSHQEINSDRTLPSQRDWFYQVRWQEKVREQELVGIDRDLKNSWLIFADRLSFAQKVAKQLELAGQNCVLVYSGNGYKELLNSAHHYREWEINCNNSEDFDALFSQGLSEFVPSLKGIIHLWSLDSQSTEKLTLEDLEKAQNLGCNSVLNLIQVLFKKSLNSQVWLITKETQAVKGAVNTVAIAQSPLWGLGKTIALEHPESWGGLIDLSSVATKDAELLVKEILTSDGEDYLAFREQKRYVARLKKVKNRNLTDIIAAEKNTRSDLNTVEKINSESSYLITGGLGALGLKIAINIAEQGAKNLVLMGRNKPSEEAKEILQTLEEKGVKLLIAQGDVSQAKDVSKVLQEIKTLMPPLKGIIHAAGVLDDGILQGLSQERFRKVLAPKVQGTWNLHQLTQDFSLDFFILFSSAASLLGSPGQGNYAAANAFLDAIAHYRKAKGLTALSINWGSFSDGMATTKRLAVKGLYPIASEKALEILPKLQLENTAQIGVIAANWQEIQQQFPNLVESPFFQEILGKSSLKSSLKNAEKKPKKQNVFDRLLARSPQQREEFLISYLQTSLAQIIQLDGKTIAPQTSLLDLGMDSLMVMEAINQLKSDLQLMLYPREFYERPRIDALAKYLASEFEKSYVNTEASSVTSPSSVNQNLVRQSLSANKPRLSVEKKLPGVVFVLSSPRAGSTLFRVMLAGHPNLCSPPELHLLPFDTMGEREKELTLSHLGEGLQRAFMELQGIDAQAAQNLVADLAKQDSPIHEIYAMLQKLAGDRYLVDKSPTYAFHRETLERAEAIFAGAKYVHLVRHPYAVIESFCRMRMDKLVASGETNPYQLAEEIWTRSNQNILDFSATIDRDRYHQIRYEDLVKKPAQATEALCEFLEIPFDASLLNPYQGERMTDGVYDKSMSVGDPNFHQRQQIDPALAETWKSIKLPHQLTETTRRLALSFNYTLPNDRSSEGASNAIAALENSMSESYINVRGLDLCLCSWGEATNPLVLCLHGILEQGAAWHEVAMRLVERGYRVVAPDLRGHGRSAHIGQGGSYNLLDFLADIDAIAAQLSDKPFTLVGHSLGSIVAAMYASIRTDKVKDLILVETVLPTEVKDDDAVEQLTTHLSHLATVAEHQTFPDLASATERLRLATPGLSDAIAEQLASRLTEPCENGVCWRWDVRLRIRTGIGFNAIARAKYLALLQRIEAPITLIYGNNSDFNRPEDLTAQQQAMPDALKYIVSGGHNLHLEAAIDLARIIGDRILEND